MQENPCDVSPSLFVVLLQCCLTHVLHITASLCIHVLRHSHLFSFWGIVWFKFFQRFWTNMADMNIKYQKYSNLFTQCCKSSLWDFCAPNSTFPWSLQCFAKSSSQTFINRASIIPNKASNVLDKLVDHKGKSSSPVILTVFSWNVSSCLAGPMPQPNPGRRRHEKVPFHRVVLSASKQPDLHGPPKTHLLPYPHPHNDGRKHVSNTSNGYQSWIGQQRTSWIALKGLGFPFFCSRIPLCVSRVFFPGILFSVPGPLFCSRPVFGFPQTTTSKTFSVPTERVWAPRFPF